MSPRREEDRLLEHEADGIQEYDNPLPGWWLWIFYATILFSAVYALNVIPGVGSGPGRIAQYEADVAKARERQAASAPAPALDDETILALARDPAQRESGRSTFVNTCSPCHREDGGGSIGPNLCDAYWIHGSRPSEILKTVSDGVPDKGMPPWSASLGPSDIAAVVAYVTSLEGTSPPDPKAPQGAPRNGATPR